ncbi:MULTISPECIES: single-stranded-DNA-specific exonuclease RecJ [Thermoactinomyces]|uniref:Single-stranded-DNA-specific exonuclease RecJ n=1 Tax=Thermoactinomyces daqus TaxID=1329516 RepID=A0A7W2AFM1_9BACL|nr:single-stranded-DNA-specific exonuclease RecJ [Thermoactinomyces daqus]MBA4541347.1 single-stranded-DNA-specific exonuclease RecJ [Thermoactinomyces daqus]MBH8606745.1 single-stranded-DNA-specific exonuclease RecJ [Thermoactinomyces sp. CICC 10521]
MLYAKGRWKAEQVDDALADKMARDCQIHPLLARILLRRGIRDHDQAKRFLQPRLEDLHDPFALDGMKTAVEEIRHALERKQKILIYGDYDADGVSSTSLMMHVFRKLGANVDYYIPNRFREGYGLNKEALQSAKEQGFELVVSVDTGISAVEEADYAKELGLGLIITDHHEPPEILPDALAVINPKKPGCSYPFKMLAGVGVAFKLATALLNRVPVEWLDLVALGTIADLVPLIEENRILAYHGLRKMNEETSVGLRALIEAADIGREVTAGHVGFALGPRINASGRLDSADTAVRLLISGDVREAESLARELDAMNRERQQLVEEMTLEAISEVEKNPERHRHVIVVAKPGWNVGVVGIVASRLVEKYYRPVLVLGIDEEKQTAKGSARSIKGFHLFQALSACRDLLPHFGGHEMAAGMTLAVKDLDLLHERLSELAQEWLTPEDYIPLLHAEGELELERIEPALIEQMEALAPYGVGNPTPLFILKDAPVARVQLMGKDKEHMKIYLQTDGGTVEAVGFRIGEAAREIAPLSRIRLLGELQMNEWNGQRSPQFIIRDLMIPHLQVFDWRSNRRDWERLKGLDHDGVCYVCSGMIKQPLQAVDLKGTVVYWDQLAERDWPAEVRAAKFVVLVDAPPDLEVFTKGLNQVKEAERLYFLFGDKEFDDLLAKVPTRDDFKRLYRLLAGREKISLSKHFSALMRHTGLQKRSLSFIIQVFEELGFLRVEHGEIRIHPNPAKKPLTDSKLYQRQLAGQQVLQTLVYSSYTELCRYLFSTIAFKHLGGHEHELQRENSSDQRFSATGDSI